jgi:hypothetical protein
MPHPQEKSDRQNCQSARQARTFTKKKELSAEAYLTWKNLA